MSQIAEDLVAAMKRPEFYPHRPDAVTVAQTHISYVFLADQEVYKIKKPVKFTFLDFSTIERRRHFCAEEVRLNRRLAADVYRGVVAICHDGGGYRLGDESDPEAIEYAVHMRRLPEDRLLVWLLEQHAVGADMIDALAGRLADFHRTADATEAVTANGDPEAIASVLGDNYRGVVPFRDRTISADDDDAIQAFARDFLARNIAVFRRRQGERRIRDGHGDLHAEHICFTTPLVIFDCVEFSHRFRYCDVASDIAFLAMDLDFRERADLASRLIASYVSLTGDTELSWLLPFYQCYRAYVRGKVDSLKSAEPEVDAHEREAARDGARRHFALSYRYTWAYRPALVVIAGLSGSGKSTVAECLAERTGFVHVNSDVVRKQLLGLSPVARHDASFAARLYSSEQSERTYAAMFEAAAEHLAAGRGVIIDATFQLRRGRDRCCEIARTAGKPILLVECRADPEQIRHRLAQRVARDEGPSDADWSVYLQQRRRFEAFGSDEERLVLECGDTDPVELSRVVERKLRESS